MIQVLQTLDKKKHKYTKRHRKKLIIQMESRKVINNSLNGIWACGSFCHFLSFCQSFTFWEIKTIVVVEPCLSLLWRAKVSSDILNWVLLGSSLLPRLSKDCCLLFFLFVFFITFDTLKNYLKKYVNFDNINQHEFIQIIYIFVML